MKNTALAPTRAPANPAFDPAGDANGYALYDEYLRGFDDVPVLRDTVALPPPRPVQPDFRHGERRDARKQARPDTQALRDANVSELELLYEEYVQTSSATAKNDKPAKASGSRKRGKRNKRKKG